MKLRDEDVCERLEILLDIVGEEKFLEISRMYGGTNIYIPKYSSYLRLIRNRDILRKYNGVNVLELANEYGLSVTHIKRILES
ncbi:Mor transcription activator family protein [Romboutsia sp. 1001713B170131_170501_G6]|uniref:Mor transcription activator family protein n=1 Tax=Romboutsia sp. 1001713B170131_170501_G6 TaxID=2787108 RepID=UPI0018AC1357|nr:Mor transcription activator family protein [Romboutsia sp. 1001713B170131_170501_G6]